MSLPVSCFVTGNGSTIRNIDDNQHYHYHDTIHRTAIDSLYAKYSAIIIAKYKLLNSCIHHYHYDQQQQEEEECSTTISYEINDHSNYTITKRYTYLLQRMTDFYISSSTTSSSKVQQQRQQSPLINAGYAIRISCILHQIQSFMTFHYYWNIRSHSNTMAINDSMSNDSSSNTGNINQTNQTIQIIILGCGLDVTGLSCLSFLDNSYNNDNDQTKTTSSSSSTVLSQQLSNIDIHVIEIDFLSICTIKVHAIQELHLLDDFKEYNNNNDHISDVHVSKNVWSGVSQFNKNARYTLIANDLQDTTLLDDMISNSTLQIDMNVPTFIVSELVVSYLSTDACNNLLKKCSTLFHNIGNCTILYEPLGPNIHNNNDNNNTNQHKATSTTTSTCNSSSNIDASSNKQLKSERTSTTRTTIPTINAVSILESYKGLYNNNFNTKLQRGLANLSQTNSSSNLVNNTTSTNQQLFNPLGTSIQKVSKRLQTIGYDRVYTSTVGTVISYIYNNYYNTMELFDEHIALTLHLSSYVLVCAFALKSDRSIETDTFDVELYQRYICPWAFSNHMGFVMHPHPFIVPRKKTKDDEITHGSKIDQDNSCIWITNISKHDEKQVREIFNQSYKHLFDQYPSIRKMVKSALHKDLGVGSSYIPDTNIHSSNSNNIMNDSIIGSYYRNLGGDFIVAVRYHPKLAVECNVPSDDDKSDRINDTNNKLLFRQVLGGIGIRKCTTDECIARSLQLSNVPCYEIHRFFVNGEFRKCSIGTKLWYTLLSSMIDRYRPCNKRSSNRKVNVPLFYITASTPTILLEANQFYIKHGFDVRSSEQVGDLMMTTYFKAIYIE